MVGSGGAGNCWAFRINDARPITRIWALCDELLESIQRDYDEVRTLLEQRQQRRDQVAEQLELTFKRFKVYDLSENGAQGRPAEAPKS